MQLPLKLFISLLLVQGQAGLSSSEPWWKIVSGILAVPAGVMTVFAGIIGLIYTYNLVIKTRLESKKIELEIFEKQKALGEVRQQLQDAQSDQVLEDIQPLVRASKIQFITLRFIFLYLALELWGVVQTVFVYLVNTSYLAFNALNGNGFSAISRIGPILVFSLSILPKFGYFWILISIGLPLIKDVNKLVGIDLKESFFKWSILGSPRTTRM